ncbi:probable glutamate--tRNA ligase, mitochondrial isoform X2 [Pieris rapae]|uniref:probable glutamate--tRNA ligase, mitochondrial isoform X2 n=1 Tax=Pieris rapae TaxID=64459 RepID=UPI001E2813C7|nr:probable glutamate--tRNA ligase, mitochondrial isoform X2 [Pieris rapae]
MWGIWSTTFNGLHLSLVKQNGIRSIKTLVPRVRFAPSPTGYLHLGGLRTALYNKLFAKSRRGAFVLRIEDTDQSRKVDGSIEALIQDLAWAGIECNEGPKQGGKYGPYIQSKRLHIYQEYIKKLLDNGSAYRCFCTERRLNILRRNAVKSQQLSSDCLSFDDLIFGTIAYDVSLVEGDPVLVKTDGYPTYHFANVVDDHLMDITHVLRGVEWQISTTKHLLIYRAFGWTPPQFGHLPLIVNADGTKLSKRQNDVRVEDYRDKGVYPLALVNFITLSGGGFQHVPGEGVRLKTMDELAQEFQIDKISAHPSRLNPDLLQECNRLEIKRQIQDPTLSSQLVAKLQLLIKEKYKTENLNIADDHIKSVLLWATSRINKIEDLVSSKFGFLWILPSSKSEVDEMLLHEVVENLENLEDFNENSIKERLREISSKNCVKFPELMKMLRSVLSGLSEGPSVAEMMQLLGKCQTIERIKAVNR